MIPLTNEQYESYEKAKSCYICAGKFKEDTDDQKYCKVRDNCDYAGKSGGSAHSICNLRYCIPKEIPVVFSQWIKL